MAIQEFEIEVWYRYVSFGEQEKEHEFHIVYAENVKEACLKAKDLYKSLIEIPFAFYHNNTKIEL